MASFHLLRRSPLSLKLQHTCLRWVSNTSQPIAPSFVLAAIQDLSMATTIPERRASVASLRKALTVAASEEIDDDDIPSDEAISRLKLRLNQRMEEMMAVYDKIVDEAAVSTEVANNEDELFEDVATEKPLDPRSLTSGNALFETVAAVLQRLEDRYGVGVGGGGERENEAAWRRMKWLDLGSGDGAATVAAALLKPWASCGGVEVRRSLHAKAKLLWQRFKHETSSDSIAFELGDIRTHFQTSFGSGGSSGSGGVEVSNSGSSSGSSGAPSLSEVDVVWFHATCFDDSLVQHVSDFLVPQLKPGAVVVTATKTLNSPLLQLLERHMLPFSWGEGVVTIQRRVLCGSDLLEGGNDGVMCALRTSEGGDRDNAPGHTPSLNALARPVPTTTPATNSTTMLAVTTALELLVDQIRVGVSRAKEGEEHAHDGEEEEEEAATAGLCLALEAAACVHQVSAGCEMNARALVEVAGMPTATWQQQRQRQEEEATPSSLLLHLLTTLLGESFYCRQETRGEEGEGEVFSDSGISQPSSVRFAPRLTLGARASACLAAAALAQHHACTPWFLASPSGSLAPAAAAAAAATAAAEGAKVAVESSGGGGGEEGNLASALLALIVSGSKEDDSTNVQALAVPPALLSAAAAALANCCIGSPAVAAHLRAFPLKKPSASSIASAVGGGGGDDIDDGGDVENLLKKLAADFEDPGSGSCNPGAAESCRALLEAIERYAPLHHDTPRNHPHHRSPKSTGSFLK